MYPYSHPHIKNMHSNIRSNRPLQFVFHDQNIFHLTRATEDGNKSPSCACSACRIKLALLPKLCLLFFIGLLFPPIYFFIWGCKVYALAAYRKELGEANPFDTGRGEGKEEEDAEDDDDSSTLQSKNPFSDKYEIGKVDSNRTVQYSQKENEKYNFDAHCSTNNRFNKWCGRSLIAFLCQVCLIIVITCAVVFASRSGHAHLGVQGL